MIKPKVFSALIFLFSGLLMGQKSFFCVESWEHDFLVAERIGDSVVTPDGELVSSFFRLGPILISKQNLNRRICKRGQGPGELENLYAYCLHPEGLAFVELPYRIKIFRRCLGTTGLSLNTSRTAKLRTLRHTSHGCFG